MHILHMPSWYSTAGKPWRGMFVRDQALAGLLRRRFDPLAIRENARRRFRYPAIANRLSAVCQRLLMQEHQEVA